jgi:hypothetical protein
VSRSESENFLDEGEALEEPEQLLAKNLSRNSLSRNSLSETRGRSFKPRQQLR